MAFNFQGGPALAMGMSQAQPNMMATGPLMPGGMMGGPMMPGMMPGFPQMSLMTPDPGQMVNPGLNDAPLEFNTNKNKPPMPITDERSSNGSQFEEKDRERRRERDRRDRNAKDARKDYKSDNGRRQSRENMGEKPMDQDDSDEDISEITTSSNGPMWLPSMPYQMMGMPIMDPNMLMPPFGMMSGVSIGDQGIVSDNVLVKEVVQLKSVTLVPPPPGTPAPTTRERPPGCKTIFVGGLAENTTEDIVKEIFSRCGEMLTVRLSNKKFCHIRFLHESSVDSALYFSGYRMRIENKTDLPNTGRLHVDFAQARDDQYEWECKQRQLQREARHRDRVEKERMRVPSPPPVPHYTEHEATTVAEKIKVEDTFQKAVQVVITWLERGDCSKRNASVFYSMIQSTNSHIRRILTEKATHEEELQKAKELMKARMQSLLLQYAQIERVFTAASHKKVWDHFTKAQRKNIEMWKKQSAEIKTIELEEHLASTANDEMDLSDEDEPIKKKIKIDDKLNSLKEENDSLRCQLEAYKNEVDLVRSELTAELENTEAQLKISRQTLQGMQKQLSEAKIAQNQEHAKVIQLETKLVQEKKEGSPASEKSTPPPPPPPVQRLNEEEARLIGLISMFLHVHPFGAGVDYIWSYVQKLEPGIKPSEVENLLARFPSLFQQELSGIGANMERKWIVTAFKTKEISNY